MQQRHRILGLLGFGLLASLSGAPAAQADPLAYVANRENATVSIIDTATNTVAQTLDFENNPDFGQEPTDAAVSPDGARVVFAVEDAGKLAVLDVASGALEAVDLGAAVEPYALAFGPDGERLYVTNDAAGEVWILDVTTEPFQVLEKIAVDAYPRALAVHPDGSRLYVNTGGGGLYALDIATAQATPLGTSPWDFALRPDGARLYLSFGDDRIEVLSTADHTTLRTITTGFSSTQFETLAFNPAGTRLYAVDASEDLWAYQVDSTADSETEIRDWDITFIDNGDVNDMAVSADGARVYLAKGSYDEPGALLVFDSVAAQVTTALMLGYGAEPFALAVAPITGPAIQSLARHPADAQRLYAGSAGQGVFVSSDGGETWTARSSGLNSEAARRVRALAVADDGATLYAGTAAGVYKSTDGGASWQAANNGLTSLSILSLRVLPGSPDAVVAGTQAGGVYKSTDGGASWQAMNNGLP